MMQFTYLAFMIVIVALVMGVSAEAAANVIPQPAKKVDKDGTFTLTAKSTIHAPEKLQSEAHLLASAIERSTGYQLAIKKVDSTPDGIVLRIDPSLITLGTEGYQLVVKADKVEIVAPTAAGVFYGTQTLLQMLPVEAFSPTKVAGVKWTVPCTEIEDSPRYPWRGSPAGLLPTLLHQEVRKEVHRSARDAQDERAALASD